MNQSIQDLPFNIDAQEVITLLGTPLSESNKGEVQILVYTSLVGDNADVLYFVDDRLKLKSLSTKKDTVVNTDFSEFEDPDSAYLLLADNRGTANEEWLSFWGDQGFAHIADDRFPGVKVDRVLYFEPMDFTQFTEVWGGAKFIKGSEQPITEITNLEVQQVESVSESPSNTLFLFGPLFLLFLVFLTIVFFIWRKKKKRPEEVILENQ